MPIVSTLSIPRARGGDELLGRSGRLRRHQIPPQRTFSTQPPMLTGRESIARLVGKRRRHLPREALLRRIGDRRAEDRAEEKKADASAVKEWVECPVCGKSIRGDDHLVNSHLDLCLNRGKRRKLTQKTLLQLNFCTKSSSLTASVESVNQLDNTTDHGHNCISGYVVSDNKACELLQRHGSIPKPVDHSTKNGESVDQVSFEKINKDVDINLGDPVVSLIPFTVDSMKEAGKFNLVETLSTAVLETFIVGNKFRNEVNLCEGSNVCVVRDYGNSNDHNALKVVCSDSGYEVIAGYLPRELAKSLSPLVDKFQLKLEGSVTSNLETSGVIPVRIFCQKIEIHDELEASDVLHWKILWDDVLRVVDYGNKCPHNMTKYQRNFHIMVKEVLDHHAHILHDDEKTFLGNFFTLSDDSQRIFIRLYTRKGPWFRVCNISYPEVKDPLKAIEELQLSGYACLFIADACPVSDIAEILDVMTVSELREISSDMISKKSNGIRKDQHIVQLLNAYEKGNCPSLPNIIQKHAGTCVKISLTAESILWRIQRLFFLNGEQDLSSFLLVDLGLVKYPTYLCTISRPIFRDRTELLAYEEAIAVAQLIDESLECDDTEIAMRCTYFSHEQLRAPESSLGFYSQFSAQWVYSKVVTLGISICERDRRYEEAVTLLKGLLGKITVGGKRGYWYLRLSIDLEHMGRINESLFIAEEGILDPWVRAGSKTALQRRVLRLGKPPRRWKVPTFSASISKKIKEVHVQGRPLNSEIGAKNYYYGYDNMHCNVEQLALQYYAEEGGNWKGVHTETGIWLTIFGLLMWDIIFSDVPDVFQTRFQTAPLDLDTDSFYHSRKDLIESHLEKIHEGMAEEIFISSWESHMGTACRGVNWERHCLLDLRAAVSCISGPCLASLLRLLAQDYRSWSRGMPDLFLWRFHGGDLDGGEAKLVEVKGPRDRLSEQQRAWILFLMDCGFEIEVCRVSETPPSP